MTPEGDGGPVRTCVACRQEAVKHLLLRLVAGASGGVVLDRAGRLPGRGAYLHPQPGCVDLARRRRALERALKSAPSKDLWQELDAIVN